MEFTDRVANHPGRITLTVTESSNSNIAVGDTITCDTTRADDPVTEGTPITADNLNQITTDIGEDINSAMSAFTIDESKNVGVRNLQAGKVTTSTIKKKSRNNKVEIKFAPAFTKVPTVVATPIARSAGFYHVSVRSVTTSRALLSVYNGTSSSKKIKVNWIAYSNVQGV